MTRPDSGQTNLRDMVGYGANPPDPKWPNGARLAVQFVLNYEEGGENTILNGDPGSETYLTEIVGLSPLRGERSLTVESLYEYGSRVGVWRLLDLFQRKAMPLTVFAVGRALEMNPDVARAFAERGHEIASHGWRWIDYHNVGIDEERAQMDLAIEVIERLTGQRPVGWYTGRNSPNTARLVAENGGFLYHSDSYCDDLPYWETIGDRRNLVVPYTLDVNDMKFGGFQGFNSGDQYFAYLKDSFDCLYEESGTTPRMMSIGLHCRMAGKPGRIMALTRFLDHVAAHDDVWICRRADIARHWHQNHAPESI